MPKFAMLVRMTEDTLDALQNLAASDKMDFEFGDKPVGILKSSSGSDQSVLRV